jgi:hypothetical protein
MKSIEVSVDCLINGQWSNLLWNEGDNAVKCRPIQRKIEHAIAQLEARGFIPKRYKVETTYREERRMVVQVYELWHDLIDEHERTLV